MPRSRRKDFFVYATHRSIFGRNYDRSELRRLIPAQPWGAVINVAAQMMEHLYDDRMLREQFFACCRRMGIDDKTVGFVAEKVKDRTLVSPQGLLAVCKWLLAFGHPDTFHQNAEEERAVGLAVYLCLIVSDYLYQEGDNPDVAPPAVLHEMLRNASFNSTEDFRLAVARTNYTYVSLAQDWSLYNPPEYVDFGSEFHEKYGYTIQDYLSVVFGLVISFMEMPRPVGVGWLRHLGTLFSRTALAEPAQQIVRDHLLVSLSDAQTWARQSLDAPWDFSLFQDKPLLAVDDDHFFPVAPRFLREQIYGGLYHKLRHCYPKSDTNFIRFFGRPFEEYVKSQIRLAVGLSPLPYQYIPEFPFVTRDGERRSPDVMVRLGHRLLAIEAKARRMQLTGLVTDDSRTIGSDISHMVTRPLKQAHDKIELLLQPRPEIDLSGVSEIHLMVVTMGEFPTLGPIERRCSNELTSHFRVPIASHHHLDIEELDYFANLVSRRRPIFQVLHNKSNHAFHQSFKNFLHEYSLPVRPPESLKQEANRFIDMVTSILFPHRHRPK